ncbi:unnamed protein product [Pleuronectes platessa]|uniref:Uncharacterized protein n=1 Tax=Pleuronectes platessa TaxID=8262 RepID=A0A9N7TT34_PLEPL|nr:unnamed protein product [Pleuronectes platessa]
MSRRLERCGADELGAERCRQRWTQVEFIGVEDEEEEEEDERRREAWKPRREEGINEEDKWSERQVVVQYPLGDAASRKQLGGEEELKGQRRDGGGGGGGGGGDLGEEMKEKWRAGRGMQVEGGIIRETTACRQEGDISAKWE